MMRALQAALPDTIGRELPVNVNGPIPAILLDLDLGAGERAVVVSGPSLTVPEGGATSGGSGEEMFTGMLDQSLAEEVPAAFVYGGRTHAVMMCTPADLEDFAVGFTVTDLYDHYVKGSTVFD